MGEPGIGKTRLMEELATCAAHAGARVLCARAFQAERLRPYGPWLDMLTSGGLGSPSGLSVLARTAAASSADREALWSAVAADFAQASERLVIVIDDLHWADEETAALLHYLVRVLPGRRAGFAVALRPGELADNVPCLRVLRALARERKITRIALGPLDAASTEALARAVRPDADASRVANESEGNPLFAIQLARARAATGPTEGVPSTIRTSSRSVSVSWKNLPARR